MLYNFYMVSSDPSSQTQDMLPSKPEPEKILFSWKAPARIFVRRDKKFWIRTISAASLFGVILFIAEGSMPVVLMIAIIFLYYVLTTVEPEDINFSITTYGIKIADKTTFWNLLVRYWFSSKKNINLLVLEMNAFPGRLEIVINKNDIPSLKKILNNYLVMEETPPSNIDKTSRWFSEKLEGKKSS